MYLQEILEVAIGLVFVWLVMSIATMSVQEWIATWRGWRARDLEATIQRMLADPKLKDKFYSHPLIKGLSRTPTKKEDAKKITPKPSYIPADKFATVLFDVVAQAGPATAEAKKMLASIRSSVATLPDGSDLKKALNGMLAGIGKGEDSLAVARANVEKWYDDSMDRLNGWYKRNAQKVAFVIGIIFALVLNVDSIAVATNLWREPTVRQALVAQAETFKLPDTKAADPAAAVAEFRARFAGLNIPIGWSFDTVSLEAGQACKFIPGPGDVFGIEINGVCKRPATATANTNGIVWIVVKILGITMSGAASAQGAPFWFDILKKLINVRGTGSNPAEDKKTENG